MQCGTALLSQTRERKPGDYTPRHLAERILTTRSALEGERKQVTVFFADVRGSLDLSEQVDAEDWHQLMDRFFAILANGVHRFEGTVNQYTGDGIMALFGAPVAHEDHARRACYAALHLRDALRGYSEELKRTRGLVFSVRMGLHSGEVVVGRIGDDLRMDYTAQGHTVGLAARVEQLATPGSAYVTAATAEQVSGSCELRDLGLFELRGARDPMRIFELERARPLRTRIDLARERGLSELVGRADELARLEAEFASAAVGRGGVVSLRGEAGEGKSRLCFEFAERCRARGCTVIEVHSQALGGWGSLPAARQLLRAALSLRDEESDERARVQIAGQLLRADPGLSELLPVAFELAGAPDPDAPAPELLPEQRPRALARLIRYALEAHERDGPVLVVWDDLHWNDPAGDALLRALVDSLGGGRVLLLASFRPEYRPAWDSARELDVLVLEPLGDEPCDALLGGLLGDHSSLGPLRQRIRASARGNPFFLEEIVQSLLESGHLHGVRGAYQARGAAQHVALPSSVQALLAARIDRLGEPEKRVLHTASVIGTAFRLPLLSRVLGEPEDALAPLLATLREAQMLRETSLYPHVEYEFRHPLTAETAYRSQLSRERERVHRAVAGALIAEQPAGASSLVAHHWDAAGEALEAARWHDRAAHETSPLDVPQAFLHWARVRELGRTLPASDETLDLRLRAYWSAIDAGGRAGMTLAEAQALFAEARELAEQRGDRAALVRLHTALAARLGWSGDPDGARRQLGLAEQIASQLGDRAAHASVLLRASIAEFHGGALAEALRLVRQGLAALESAPAGETDELYRTLLLNQASPLQALGRLDESEALLERFDELARGAAATGPRARNRHTYALLGANLAWFRGDGPGALRGAEQLLEQSRRSGSSWARPVSRLALGRAELLSGRAAEARVAFAASLELARSLGLGLEAEPSILAGLAEALCECGAPDQALETAREAVAAGRRMGTRVWELQAHLSLARVRLQVEGAAARESVERILNEAETLLVETGAEWLRPGLHERRAELARVLGSPASQELELREALRAYQEMGAHGHVARLRAALGY